MTDSESQAEEVFDLERIRRLVELMEEHGLSEVDLRQEGQRIRLRRSDAGGCVEWPGGCAASRNRLAPIPVVTEGHRVEDENIVLIRSPMVGTFYTRANPDAETFVKVGDHVTPETTVCMIEAMKVFNEIPAEISGRDRGRPGR